MTTQAPHDVNAMAAYRRSPLEDTGHMRAYRDMLKLADGCRQALVQANPSEAALEQISTTLTALRQLLEEYQVPEQDRWYGRGDIGDAETQLLLPPLIVDHLDDQRLQAHTTAGESFLGINGALHGGIISALFDTGMGRLAMSTQTRVARTAYLTTQYRNIAPVQARLDMTAKVTSIEGRKKFLAAQLWHGDTLCAEAEALFVQVRPGHD